MIEVLQAPFTDTQRDTLRKLYQTRYELFVEGRGWRSLQRPDRLDRDDYDDDSTIYFIRWSDNDIVAGARLRPTVKRHMLQEVFGTLCEGGYPPIGPAIFECSRTFVARRHPERRILFAQLLRAVAAYCAAHEIGKLTGVLETWWLNSYLSLGLNATPLGMPQKIDGMSLLAVSFDVSQQTVIDLESKMSSMREIKADSTADRGRSAA